jgi:hypothetical protein
VQKTQTLYFEHQQRINKHQMKTAVLILSAITMTLSSFNTYPTKNISNDAEAAQRMGLQVVVALQRQSASEYAALYPTSESLLKLMDRNAAVYGDNLAEAKRDLEAHFQAKVVPSLNRSFYDILEKGKEEGIDWRAVKLSDVKVGEAGEKGTPIELVLISNGTTFTIRYERTLTIDGQLKVSPFVSMDM